MEVREKNNIIIVTPGRIKPSIRVRGLREGKIMKITKAEGYKKPNYALALAAAMVAVTVSGCGSQHDSSRSLDLEGATTLGAPEEQELTLSGDIAEPVGPSIDYDGGFEIYTDPDAGKVQPDGDVSLCIENSEDEDDITDIGEPEEQEAVAYYEPLDDLVLEGGAPVYEP